MAGVCVCVGGVGGAFLTKFQLKKITKYIYIALPIEMLWNDSVILCLSMAIAIVSVFEKFLILFKR